MGEEGLEDLQVIREKENKEGLNESSTLENRNRSQAPLGGPRSPLLSRVSEGSITSTC